MPEVLCIYINVACFANNWDKYEIRHFRIKLLLCCSNVMAFINSPLSSIIFLPTDPLMNRKENIDWETGCHGQTCRPSSLIFISLRVSVEPSILGILGCGLVLQLPWRTSWGMAVVWPRQEEFGVSGVTLLERDACFKDDSCRGQGHKYTAHHSRRSTDIIMVIMALPTDSHCSPNVLLIHQDRDNQHIQCILGVMYGHIKHLGELFSFPINCSALLKFLKSKEFLWC